MNLLHCDRTVFALREGNLKDIGSGKVRNTQENMGFSVRNAESQLDLRCPWPFAVLGKGQRETIEVS